MYTISLTKGKVASVSEEDLEYLSQWSWGIHTGGYAKCRTKGNGAGVYLFMHRAIVERMTGQPIPEGYEVDHVDGNKLNNLRQNLRLVTKSQNNMNRDRYCNSASQYKGVSRQGKKWRATIVVNKQQKYLGCYETQTEAAKVYDRAALEMFGEFARLNFPVVWVDPDTIERVQEEE